MVGIICLGGISLLIGIFITAIFWKDAIVNYDTKTNAVFSTILTIVVAVIFTTSIVVYITEPHHGEQPSEHDVNVGDAYIDTIYHISNRTNDTIATEYIRYWND